MVMVSCFYSQRRARKQLFLGQDVSEDLPLGGVRWQGAKRKATRLRARKSQKQEGQNVHHSRIMSRRAVFVQSRDHRRIANEGLTQNCQKMRA
jgi:hypothetical protein